MKKNLSECSKLEVAQILDVALKSFSIFSESVLEDRMLPLPFDIKDKRRICMMLEAGGYIERLSYQSNNSNAPTVFPHIFSITPKGMMFYLTSSFVCEYNKKQKALKEESFRVKKVRWELCISILSLILSIIVFLDNAQIISFRFY